jgi:hypothetical protein
MAAAAVAAAWLLAEPPGSQPAWIAHLKGRVEINNSGPALPGATLGKNDIVESHDAAAAFIRCGAGLLARLVENSELRVGRSRVDILRGGACFKVRDAGDREPFRVNAGPATVRAWGTVFRVDRLVDGERITVREGVVSILGAGRELFIMGGHVAEMRGGRIAVRLMSEADTDYFGDMEGVAGAVLELYMLPARMRLEAGMAGERLSGLASGCGRCYYDLSLLLKCSHCAGVLL